MSAKIVAVCGFYAAVVLAAAALSGCVQVLPCRCANDTPTAPVTSSVPACPIYTLTANKFPSTMQEMPTVGGNFTLDRNAVSWPGQR